ncbi:MAG: hypothetical protein MK101_07715 [Phycisphaerales bacterium]|nr:hypothetical protein [Phycisphaerales bacterium]
MATSVNDSARTRVDIERVDADRVVVSIPGNAYSISLRWGGEDPPTTGRMHGWVQAHALKVQAASAGGRFIEPLSGAPRIMAGRVEAVDTESATIALRCVLPVHVALERREDLSLCTPGAMVNFHVRSDAAFVPQA